MIFMNYRVAFFCKHFGQRGTERTTYDYADFNEIILGNKSYIICFSEKTIIKNKYIKSKYFMKKKYSDRFEIFEIDNIFEIKDILLKNKITHFYAQSHGFHRDIFEFDNFKIWSSCKTIYHSVFGPMARQGSNVRCIVGEYLNNRFNKNLPILPHIIRPFKFQGDLRKQLNIPQDSIVIGRHGGKETFNIDFVKQVIKKIVNFDQNIYFLFLNTEVFFNHKRVIHLENFSDLEVIKFIGTCDAMIHARIEGETFGLAIAEFSVANKPVITYSKSKDKEHLRILKNSCIKYSDENDLISIFKSIRSILKKELDWNAYKDYEPEKIMQLFRMICLENVQESRSKLISNFTRDLPWEIIIYIKLSIKFFINLLNKIIPFYIKRKIKHLINLIK